MIEQIMYVGIGFLIAGLLVLGCIPLVHARAVRLTMRRVEALTPLSMAEIQADKDQLRAEFAMSTRRLEMSVEQMKAKTTSQLTEIGKKSEAIGRLKLELGDKTAALLALEAREKQLNDDTSSARGQLAANTAALDEAERALSDAKEELSRTAASLHENVVTVDGQRVELVAYRAQVEVLKGQIESYENETKQLQERLARETKVLQDRLARETAELRDQLARETKELQGRIALQTTNAEALNLQLIEERSKSENFAGRVGELERQLVAETTEAEILSRRVQELGGRLDEQGRFLADREYDSDRLRTDIAGAQKTEADLRAELAEAEKRHQVATQSLRAEKVLVEEQLKQSHDEREKLQREIAGMKREAESNWANERTENAMLRERINDVAAEVARLTATLEGPGSPIESIVNGDAGRPQRAAAAPAANVAKGAAEKASPSIAPNGGASKGTLADRIRALQSRASRVAQPSEV